MTRTIIKSHLSIKLIHIKFLKELYIKYKMPYQFRKHDNFDNRSKLAKQFFQVCFVHVIHFELHTHHFALHSNIVQIMSEHCNIYSSKWNRTSETKTHLRCCWCGFILVFTAWWFFFTARGNSSAAWWSISTSWGSTWKRAKHNQNKREYLDDQMTIKWRVKVFTSFLSCSGLWTLRSGLISVKVYKFSIVNQQIFWKCAVLPKI